MKRQVWLVMAALLMVPACRETPRPSERGGQTVVPNRTGTWLVPGGELRLAAGTLTWHRKDRADVLAREVLGLPAVRGGRIVVAHRPEYDGRITAFELQVDGTVRKRLLTNRGSPDRPALSPDGRHVAFVSAATGIASVWLVRFDGSALRQLTNQGLRRSGRRAPAGFVPVPDSAPPRFADGRLVWTVGGRRHAVELP